MSEYPIHAYLSYRCIDRDQNARNELEPLCKENHIELLCSENTLKDGEKFVAFMDDLAADRVVFIFLSKEYFESAYTLYELISINEQGDLDKRLINFIRLDNRIGDKYINSVRDFWYSDAAAADRNKLADDLLKCKNDKDFLWQRIEKACKNLTSDFLGENHKSYKDQRYKDKFFSQLIDQAKQKISFLIDEEEQKLLQKVENNLCDCLERSKIALPDLAGLLGLTNAATATEIAQCLSSNNQSVGNSLDWLIDFSQKQEKILSQNSSEWKAFLFSIEQLAGWLLIKTVDKHWWFHEQLKIQRARKSAITSIMDLNEPAYIEVIIARDLLQEPKFALDQFGNIKPASETHDVLVFEAVKKEATDIQLLEPMYKDLRRWHQAPNDISELTSAIQKTVKALSGARNGKPIYYLVSKDHLTILNSREWFKAFEAQMTGYLQFICCESPEKDNPDLSCVEDQGLLLEKVAILLRLKNSKEA